MNVSPNNDKIEKYLDELSKEYKELLFRALVEQSKSLDDLSVSELLRIDSEIKKPLFRDYQKQQKRRRIILIGGLTYIFVGFFLLILYKFRDYNNSTIPSDIIPLMAMVISFVGCMLTVLSFTMSTLRNSSNRQKIDTKRDSLALLEYEVITKWRDLEGITNDISVENGASKTTKSVIEYLFNNQLIDDDERNSLRKFLEIRNNIVHSTGTIYSPDEIEGILKNIDYILKKLSKIV